MTSLLKFSVLMSLLTSRASCLASWKRQNFPALLKIEQTLSHGRQIGRLSMPRIHCRSKFYRKECAPLEEKNNPLRVEAAPIARGLSVYLLI